MLLARITGSVTATAKDPQLSGLALLTFAPEGGAAEGVAADTVGAGVGDTVLITTGSAARLPVQTSGKPVDAAIVAIVDQAGGG